MKKRIALIILCATLTSIYSVNASDEILLKSRRFIPTGGITPAARTKIEAIPKRAHVLLQLNYIPTPEQRRELEARGVKLLSYIPHKAWFASIPSTKASEIAALSNVRAIGEILPEDKISPMVRERGIGNHAINEDGSVNLIVMFHKDISLNEGSKIISNYNGKVTGKMPIINALVVTVSNETIIALADDDSVHWINEVPPPPKIRNDGSRAAIGVDTVQAPPYNLTGTGVIVGEWDGGCVDDTHDDLTGRVTQRNCGSVDNHATHVAGTLLGDGSINWTYRGMATNATVVSYYFWEQDNIDDLNSDYEDAINNMNISISTNSWGYRDQTAYNEIMAAIDAIVGGNITRPITIVWAIPNEGESGWGWIGEADGSKNVISVGSINSNDNSRSYFSSLGPTPEPWGGPWEFGRIKPDVMAAGCQVGGDGGITSTVPGDEYGVICGTSMATPAVSGSVALMLEDWRDNHSDEPDPLPSTIKSILIQTATDLGNTGPDYSHGYGLINAQDAIDLIRQDTSDNVILEDSIFGQGDIDTFTVDVPQGQSELIITLVWDDYPGNPAAAQALVNDLDLIVREPPPGQTRRYPWTLDPENPGNPAVRSQEDHINNIEQVYVDNPVSGTWTIEISGTTVPKPAQLYSLVSNFAFGPTPPRAYDDGIFTEVGTPVEITLRATDDGLPTPPGVLTYIVTSLPGHGTLSDPGTGQISSVPYTLADNGNQVIYMPNAGYGGQDSFKFKANDNGTPPNGGDSDEATINVYVFGLVNWWKFDDGSGSTAEDSVGDKDGTLTNMDPETDWVTGKIDGALDFDGDNDYVSIAPIDALKGNTVTISAWIQANSVTGEYSPIVTQYYFHEGHHGYHLCLKYAKPTFSLDGSDDAQSDDDIDTTPYWYHLAGTYDGQKLRIYVDGVLKDSTDYADESDRNTDAYIGYDGYSYFYGIIDDVRVYNWALNTFEIWDAMSGDLPRFRIKNSSDETVAWFDSFGNLCLKGERLEESADPIPPGSFIIKDSEDAPVAYIDNQGNLWINGSLSVLSGSCNPEGDAFIIKNPSDANVAYIDFANGDLCLTGKLYQQNP